MEGQELSQVPQWAFCCHLLRVGVLL